MYVWNLKQLASNHFKPKIIRYVSSTKVATGTYNPRQNPKVYGHLHVIERQMRVMEGGVPTEATVKFGAIAYFFHAPCPR